LSLHSFVHHSFVMPLAFDWIHPGIRFTPVVPGRMPGPPVARAFCPSPFFSRAQRFSARFRMNRLSPENHRRVEVAPQHRFIIEHKPSAKLPVG
jgi:hypothetical protein